MNKRNDSSQIRNTFWQKRQMQHMPDKSHMTLRCTAASSSFLSLIVGSRTVFICWEDSCIPFHDGMTIAITRESKVFTTFKITQSTRIFQTASSTFTYLMMYNRLILKRVVVTLSYDRETFWMGVSSHPWLHFFASLCSFD